MSMSARRAAVAVVLGVRLPWCTAATEQDPIVEFDNLLSGRLDTGSGVYYEFDTASSEVVRTGQVQSTSRTFFELRKHGWLSTSTRVPLASGSKLFTAFGAMLTMQLKPDEFHPGKYIHEFEGWHNFCNFKVSGTAKRANLTVHHLLTHTSGLPFCLFCSRQDVERAELFYWPGDYFGYTIGHRLIGWLLHDFWKRQPEGKAAGVRTVRDTFQWLVFDRLQLSPLTGFALSMHDDLRISPDAGDASIQATGEDFMRLAVVALRRGRLPGGEQLISQENWDRWAVPNLLPGRKLTEQLVSWQGSSARFQDLVSRPLTTLGDKVSQYVMKQSGAYGWNYFGATYNNSSEVGWCGFFSSCLHVSYTQDLAFVLMQNDFLDKQLKGSKDYMVDNFDGMARSLQCPDSNWLQSANATFDFASTFCAWRPSADYWYPLQTPENPWFVTGWTPMTSQHGCPSGSQKAGSLPWTSIDVPENHRACYTPFRRPTERCHRGHCDPGLCLTGDGRCESTAACRKDTGGTCALSSCDVTRGPTVCSKGRCLCEVGYCEAAGTCVPRAPVIDATCLGPVGTCSVLSCDQSRGPTLCASGQCLCREGYCPQEGKCVKRALTAAGSEGAPPRRCLGPVGTCALFSCDQSRGPTFCAGRRPFLQCFCREGYCPQGGKCVKRALLAEEPAPEELAARTAGGWVRAESGAAASGLAVVGLGLGLLCAARLLWPRWRTPPARPGALLEAFLAVERG